MGVQGLAQAPTEWYGRDRHYGMGRRECKYLPLHIQARAGASAFQLRVSLSVLPHCLAASESTSKPVREVSGCFHGAHLAAYLRLARHEMWNDGGAGEAPLPLRG